ncbi:hypothetical protein [Bacillus sp. Bos-x628]|uniref:hypothetical protein n=1 Tax=Bacillus maqinnsis TaxID=3229854 RepID=UPI00338DC5B7
MDNDATPSFLSEPPCALEDQSLDHSDKDAFTSSEKNRLAEILLENEQTPKSFRPLILSQ